MAWNKFESRKAETKAVKSFLSSNGYINPKVGHGTGTAWGWLEIRTEVKKPSDCECNLHRVGRCRSCQEAWQNTYSKLSSELMAFTGRSGDYGGCISIEIQLI